MSLARSQDFHVVCDGVFGVVVGVGRVNVERDARGCIDMAFSRTLQASE